VSRLPFNRSAHTRCRRLAKRGCYAIAPELDARQGDVSKLTDTVAQMRRSLAQGRSGSEIVVYPGAPHGFNADYRPSYRKEIAEDGWRRMAAWFRVHGVG
jgi:dienelactone hydrolase